MAQSITEYKSLIRNKRFQYDKRQTDKLNEVRYKNAKMYWNMLKEAHSGKKSTNININDFERYFKAINTRTQLFIK